MSQQDFETNKVLLSTGKTLTVPITQMDESSNQEGSDSVVIEKVRNVWGSSSGAGSDFLDNYRKGRNVEMQRLEEMDKKWREEMENKLFQSQRIHRINKESEKALKRKIKRDKKKKKIASSKKVSKIDYQDHNDSEKHDKSDIKEGEIKKIENKNKIHEEFKCGQDKPISERKEITHLESPESKSKLIIVEESSNDF